MKIRILLVLTFILIILSGGIIGNNYKSKIPHLIPNDESLSDFRISISKLRFEGIRTTEQNEELKSGDFPELGYDTISFDDLYSASDIIAIVKPTGERELKPDDILSEVIVKEIIKGKNYIQEDKIYIYESFRINYIFLKKRVSSFQNQNRIDYKGVSNIMQSNREYIVFLKRFETPLEYECTDKELVSFIFTDRYFGQFPFSLDNYLIIDEEQEHDYTYKDIMDYDSVTEDIEFFDNYSDFQNEVLEKLELQKR